MFEVRHLSRLGWQVDEALHLLSQQATTDSKKLLESLRAIRKVLTPLDTIKPGDVDSFMFLMQHQLLKALKIEPGKHVQDLGPPMRIWHALFNRLIQNIKNKIPPSEEDMEEAYWLLWFIRELDASYTDESPIRRMA